MIVIWEFQIIFANYVVTKVEFYFLIQQTICLRFPLCRQQLVTNLLNRCLFNPFLLHFPTPFFPNPFHFPFHPFYSTWTTLQTCQKRLQTWAAELQFHVLRCFKARSFSRVFVRFHYLSNISFRGSSPCCSPHILDLIVLMSTKAVKSRALVVHSCTDSAVSTAPKEVEMQCNRHLNRVSLAICLHAKKDKPLRGLLVHLSRGMYIPVALVNAEQFLQPSLSNALPAPYSPFCDMTTPGILSLAVFPHFLRFQYLVRSKDVSNVLGIALVYERYVYMAMSITNNERV